MSHVIYFWQRIITPHMAYLAETLAEMGHSVVYVANQSMSPDRKNMGWTAPVLKHASLQIATNAGEITTLVTSAPLNSVHFCQGLRANGLVGIAQKELVRRSLRQWVLIETVDDAGYDGFLKRLVYRLLLWRWRSRLQGILAIGWKTSDWLISLGANPDTTFPFAYFLASTDLKTARNRPYGSPLRFLFVGQLILRKRVDYLIKALVDLQEHQFELVVVGDGPMRQTWQALADVLLPGRVIWVGRMGMANIQNEMNNADCLVLPSRHDGWGAVVSEALMSGTPVVCSSACGSSGVVKASNRGGVFPAGDVRALTIALQKILAAGPLDIEERTALAQWATSLGTQEGACYLQNILADTERPVPPWDRLQGFEKTVH